jgi:hypothetical protein
VDEPAAPPNRRRDLAGAAAAVVIVVLAVILLRPMLAGGSDQEATAPNVNPASTASLVPSPPDATDELDPDGTTTTRSTSTRPSTTEAPTTGPNASPPPSEPVTTAPTGVQIIFNIRRNNPPPQWNMDREGDPPAVHWEVDAGGAAVVIRVSGPGGFAVQTRDANGTRVLCPGSLRQSLCAAKPGPYAYVLEVRAADGGILLGQQTRVLTVVDAPAPTITAPTTTTPPIP